MQVLPTVSDARFPLSAAPVFAALGDPVRLSIVSRLAGEGPLSTIQLRNGALISRQGVTKHLSALERAGLVQSGRAGRDRIWALRAERITEIRGYLDQISQQWDEAIDRLRAFVEILAHEP